MALETIGDTPGNGTTNESHCGCRTEHEPELIGPKPAPRKKGRQERRGRTERTEEYGVQQDKSKQCAPLNGRADGNQRLLRYGRNVLGGNPKPLFKWASSRTSHNLLMVSRCDSDRSESTRSTARNANVASTSALRSKAVRMEGEPMTSRNRKIVAASVRFCFGGKFWHSRTCASLRASTIT
jgi:hypothetical protein